MPRFAANLTLLYNEHAFLDRFAAAAQDGFQAVEYLFPYAFERKELAQRLRDNGLQQVLFNAPPGDWDAGERGLACLPGREAEFRDGFAHASMSWRAWHWRVSSAQPCKPLMKPIWPGTQTWRPVQGEMC